MCLIHVVVFSLSWAPYALHETWSVEFLVGLQGLKGFGWWPIDNFTDWLIKCDSHSNGNQKTILFLCRKLFDPISASKVKGIHQFSMRAIIYVYRFLSSWLIWCSSQPSSTAAWTQSSMVDTITETSEHSPMGLHWKKGHHLHMITVDSFKHFSLPGCLWKWSVVFLFVFTDLWGRGLSSTMSSLVLLVRKRPRYCRSQNKYISYIILRVFLLFELFSWFSLQITSPWNVSRSVTTTVI